MNKKMKNLRIEDLVRKGESQEIDLQIINL